MKRYDIKVLPTVVKAMIIENYVGNSFGKGHVRYSPNMVWKERERHASGIELPAPLDRVHAKPYLDTVEPRRVKAT